MPEISSIRGYAGGLGASGSVRDVTGRFQLSFPEPRRRDGWFRIGSLDVTTTALLSLLAVASMVLYAINREWFSKLVFFASDVRSGEIWRLVTWPLANIPNFWVMIGVVFFWVFGHHIEELIGRMRFTGLVGLVTVVPAAIVSLIGSFHTTTAAAVGLGLLGTVMLVIFAAERPNQPFIFGIPAWVVAAVFVGLDILRYVGDRLWGTLIQLLLMLAIALVMVRQWGFANDLTFIPRFGSPKTGARSRQGATSRSSARPRKQGRDFDRVVTAGPWAGPSPADQAEMDRLLDKMNSVGLSDTERKRLSELGKRLRGN